MELTALFSRPAARLQCWVASPSPDDARARSTSWRASRMVSGTLCAFILKPSPKVGKSSGVITGCPQRSAM